MLLVLRAPSPLWVFPVGMSVPRWGYKLPHFFVLLLHCTTYVLPTATHPETKAYCILHTIMCLRIFFLGSPVSFPRHTQKDDFLSGDSSVVVVVLSFSNWCTKQWNNSFSISFMEYPFTVYHILWTLRWLQVSDQTGRKDPENTLRWQWRAASRQVTSWLQSVLWNKRVA